MYDSKVHLIHNFEQSFISSNGYVCLYLVVSINCTREIHNTKIFYQFFLTEIHAYRFVYQDITQ